MNLNNKLSEQLSTISQKLVFTGSASLENNSLRHQSNPFQTPSISVHIKIACLLENKKILGLNATHL